MKDVDLDQFDCTDITDEEFESRWARAEPVDQAKPAGLQLHSGQVKIHSGQVKIHSAIRRTSKEGFVLRKVQQSR